MRRMHTSQGNHPSDVEEAQSDAKSQPQMSHPQALAVLCTDTSAPPLSIRTQEA